MCLKQMCVLNQHTRNVLWLILKCSCFIYMHIYIVAPSHVSVKPQFASMSFLEAVYMSRANPDNGADLFD